MNDDRAIDLPKAVAGLLRGPQQPDKAFISGGATFGEVYAMAAGLRRSLDELDEAPAVLCLAAERKDIMAAALLCSLAGGPSLLLPYALTPRVLRALQQSTSYLFALTDGDKAAEFLPAGVKEIRPRSTDGARLELDCRLQSELLKMYTGGSTGSPQLWSKTCANIFAEALFHAHSNAVSAEDTIVATVSPYHIYGLLFSVALPLVSQATVIDTTPCFPAEIEHSCTEARASILVSVPAHYRTLGNRRLGLRLAFSSAGMLAEEDNRRFCSSNAIGVTEVFGSTETGGIATRNRGRGQEHFSPLATVDWKIKDRRLAVSSPYISPGLDVDDEGYFLTSDRVEEQPQSTFAFMGRIDSIVKIGGKRVDLEELRQLMAAEKGVTDCVVLTLDEAGGREKRICALLQGADIDIRGIQRKLAQSLQPYALPRGLKTVERLPVKDNGKYDWDAIRSLMAQ